MQEVVLDKVTANIGAGSGGEPLENARTLLKRLTGASPVSTLARTRNPSFKVRKGDAIGVKVTLRKAPAAEFLKKALAAKDGKLPEKSFDRTGNVSFGVAEYIDFPGAKYDPKIGMMGFDVCVTLRKPGARVARRRIAVRRLPRKQLVKKEEAIAFMKTKFNAIIE